ncbi:Smr/MutS family protein [Sphingomonas sp. AOB5]|uniref:Smr/MutS family protein n=1 Tax=Sphingomonas sp. AOB5 TaxID=3034017 RepID=UPI0023F680DA|nr:Smr/MutS family protein [Sphingomonas sp. AOB5]MDF7774675.1 Smr/MutS family protein [Sphingomonas sp. AOB5]
MSRGRKLAPEEAALWQKVIATVKPIAPVKPMVIETGPAPVSPPKFKPAKMPPPAPAPVAKRLTPPSTTLDGSWDRRLSRGLVSPESSIDLHGYTLASAYDRLDRGLEAALGRGDRVLLLVTGKAPGPESERPHKRGAIRAAVGDWLAASRFSDRIAAVRGAHPRHGGAGALYIVLRRPRNTVSQPKS